MSAIGSAIFVLCAGFTVYDLAHGNYVTAIFDAAAMAMVACDLWNDRKYFREGE